MTKFDKFLDTWFAVWLFVTIAIFVGVWLLQMFLNWELFLPTSKPWRVSLVIIGFLSWWLTQQAMSDEADGDKKKAVK